MVEVFYSFYGDGFVIDVDIGEFDFNLIFNVDVLDEDFVVDLYGVY